MFKAGDTSKCFSSCSFKHFQSLLKRWFPILTWLPHYTLEDLKGDLIAGLTVGLTVIPQGLALAQLAGLPPQYGLYTAFMGSFMYSIFGTCKDLVIGPTSVMAIMTADYVLYGGPKYAVVLTFLSGCIQLLFGIFNLGFLVNFVSASVLSGFTTAAAIIIAASQLKGLLGLKFQSRGFLENLYKTFLNIRSANLHDFGMGVIAILFLNFLKHFKDNKCKHLKFSSWFRNVVQVMWWSLATSRNLIVVLLCSVVAAAYLSLGKHVFTLTQHVDSGLPQFSLPPFSISFEDTSTNVTIHRNILFILKDLGSGAIIVPFLSLLEAIAIAKVFSKSKRLEATKEMIALGIGNIMGSFVSAYPATASFSRTVINNSTGVRTPLGGIFSGMLVLLALGLIAPSFHYIPKACLSAIIFSAVIFMIHYQDIPAMWRTSRLDLIPFSITFCLSITLGLEYGLLFGVAVSLAMLLYKQNKPKINVEFNKVDDQMTYIHVKPDNTIFFPSIESLKGKISKAIQSIKGEQCRVIIHGNRLTGIDYATAMGIMSMAASLEKENIVIEIHASEPSSLKALSCLEKHVNICKSNEEMQSLIAEGSTTDEKHQKDSQEDMHESESTVALLSTTELKSSGEAHNVV